MDKPKTVRVRIAVAVDETGVWASAGFPNHRQKDTGVHDKEMQEFALEGVSGRHVGFHWIEADIPIPVTTTQVVEPTEGTNLT